MSSAEIVVDLKSALATQSAEEEPAVPAYREKALLTFNVAGHGTLNDAQPSSLNHADSKSSLSSGQSFPSVATTVSNEAYQHSIRSRSNTSRERPVLWNQQPQYAIGAASPGVHDDPSLSKLNHDEADGYLPHRLSISESGDEREDAAQSLSHLARTASGEKSPTINEPKDADGGEIEYESRMGVLEGNINRAEKGIKDPDSKDPVAEHHKRILRERKTWSVTQKLTLTVSILVAVLAIIAMVVLLSQSKSKKMTRAIFMGCILLLEVAVITGMVSRTLNRVGGDKVLTSLVRSRLNQQRSRFLSR
jgi:hypothetical protein